MRLLIVLLACLSLGCVMMFKEQDIINRERAKCEGICLGAKLRLCEFKHNKLDRTATCTCCGTIEREDRYEESTRCI